ncbi:DUF418 domain-containing protein [Sphingomicrobium sediminis]|uniref:DUF418 domain-containing protein n=1 Tax=Sphingomicrobium sediminis TaxID=2950949 RepID=A0A9X2EM38_9SPHN|nr:DUF418 domain-containing protein [Sphingomicrobium sediminis]MCM8557882.1 DUF418 domain-containing protein [Sphingomicrobium sediminis]
MNDTPMPAGPIDAKKRIILLDGLRGFALLGILFANMTEFIGWPYMTPEQDAAVTVGWPDTVTEFFFEMFVHGKFYALFSLLFGIGFALQLKRIQERGEGTGRYARRLGFLMMFGLLHIILLWIGDILLLYSVMGFALLALRGLSNRALIFGAILCWLIPIGWEVYKVEAGFNVFAALMPIATPWMQQLGFTQQDYMGVGFWVFPDYWTHLKSSVIELYLRFVVYADQMRFTKVLGMFLIGLWVGRKGIHADPVAYGPLLRKVATWGLVIGLPFALLRALIMTGLWAPDMAELPILNTVAYVFSAPFLALAYASIAALAWNAGKQAFFETFSPIGRMALTNYILQSVIAITIFFGWGFGMILKVPLVAIIPITAAIFIAQVWWSKWWLARYRFGPLEWLWRSLTYGKAQPMRLAAMSAPQTA